MKNGCKKGPGRRRRPGLTFNFSGSRQMGKNSPSGLSKQSADRPPHFRRPGSAVQVGGNGGLIVQHGLRCFLDFPRGLDGLRVAFFLLSQESIICADMIIAKGLAIPLPAMSGAEPWVACAMQ